MDNLIKFKNNPMFNFFKKCEYYPPVDSSIDLRLRLPFKKIKKITALNVGVGSGYSGLAMQLPFLNFKRLDHIDIHTPYLLHASARSWFSEKVNFIEADIRNFNTSIYDIVLMFDVLEHLPKEDSLKILKSIDCQQVVFIPLENVFRENTFGAKSQDHLSFWTREDFESMGYKTEVLSNFHQEGEEVFDALWALK